MQAEKRDRIAKVILTAVIVLLALSAGINYLGRSNVKTMVIPSDVEYVSYSGYGFVQSESYVLPLAFRGWVSPITQEGERVAKNYAVFALSHVDSEDKVVGDPSYFYAPISGLVSYRPDGYEDTDDFSSICALDFAALYQAPPATIADKVGEAAAAGAKIINNVGNARLVCKLPSNDYTRSLLSQERLRLSLPDLGVSVSGKITAVQDLGSELAFDVDLGVVDDRVYLSRFVRLEIGYNQAVEISVPTEAVVYRDGEAGVYIVSKKFVAWHSVETLGTTAAGKIIVSGLNEGDIVVINSKRVHEGMYLR